MPAPILKVFICPWCLSDCTLTKMSLGVFYICSNVDCKFSCRANWKGTKDKYQPSEPLARRAPEDIAQGTIPIQETTQTPFVRRRQFGRRVA